MRNHSIRNRILVVGLGFLLAAGDVSANLDCKNPDVQSKDYSSAFKRAGKTQKAALIKTDVLGKWFMRLQGKYGESTPDYVFHADGTVDLYAGKADFELRGDRVLIKRRSTGTPALDRAHGVENCRVAFKVEGSPDELWVPSREMGLSALYRAEELPESLGKAMYELSRKLRALQDQVNTACRGGMQTPSCQEAQETYRKEAPAVEAKMKEL